MAGSSFQNLAEPGVIAITDADTLWLCEIVAFAESLSGDTRHQIHQAIDADHFIGAKIEAEGRNWSASSVNAFYAIIDIRNVGTSLLAIAPHFDFATVHASRATLQQIAAGDFPYLHRMCRADRRRCESGPRESVVSRHGSTHKVFR